MNLLHVIIGLIPAGILGVLFEDYIDDNLFSINTVVIGLVIGAILMIIADVFGGKKPTVNSLDAITYKQAFTVGLVSMFITYGQVSPAQVQPFQVVF